MRLLSIPLMLVVAVSARAQFSPDFLMSQFPRVEFMRNPAAAGIVPGNNFHLFSRNDLPTPYSSGQFNYFAASFDGANDSSQLGLGILAFFVREIAFGTLNEPFNAYTTAFDGAFSYSTPLSSDVSFRLGGTIGLRVKTVPIYPIGNNLQGVDSRVIPAIGFGMMLVSDRFRAGVAAYNLTNPTITFDHVPQVRLNESRLYIAQVSFIAYEDAVWVIEPAAALKVKQAIRRPVADVAVLGRFANKVLFGAGLRGGDIARPYANLQLGAIIGDVEIAVSYDIPIVESGVVALKYVEATLGVTL